MANLKYIKISSIFDKVDKLFETGLSKGWYCGFESLFEHYSPKPKSTTFLFGHPFSGKSEFGFEIQTVLSENNGFVHVVCSPETGTPEEITLELISKAAREPVYQTRYLQKVNDANYFRYRDWVSEHFYIVDPEEEAITLSDFYATVDLIEQENEVKISTTLCDPFNEMKHDMNGERQDLYLEQQLGEVLRNAKANNRHNFLVTHTSRQDVMKGVDVKGASINYYPIPTPHQVSGGLAWNRKAMNLIAVWRPPTGLILDGSPVEDNEAHVIIHKFKPKGTGKKGTVKLFFDPTKNRFYEQINGQKSYAKREQRATNYVAAATPFDF